MTGTTLDPAASLDPVTLSVFISALAGIAEEMGAMLVRIVWLLRVTAMLGRRPAP